MADETRSLLRGKVAIISGGGRGIGAATAVALAHAGAAVTVASRTVVEIEAVAERIREARGKAVAVPTNIADAEQVQRVVLHTVDTFGRVDFLINCAATTTSIGEATWDVDPGLWKELIDIDLVGVFLICHAVLPHMLRQGSGRLINLSSGAGERILPRASAYCAARAGANHFIRVLAAELIGTGVTANIVYPGIVETRGLQEFRSALFGANGARLGRNQGGIRARDPWEPATLLLWLCSPGTAWITGQIVCLDDPAVQRRLAAFLRNQAVVRAGPRVFS